MKYSIYTLAILLLITSCTSINKNINRSNSEFNNNIFLNIEILNISPDNSVSSSDSLIILYTFKNTDSIAYWINTHGLLTYINIQDSNHNMPNRICMGNDDYLNDPLPYFILLLPKDSVKIHYTSYILRDFSFKECEEYSLSIGYRGLISKRCSKNKTIISRIDSQTIHINICP